MKKYVMYMMMVAVVLSTGNQIQAQSINESLNLKGDFRMRVQSESKDSTSKRLRQRIRFRLGGENAISEQTKVKFGFATGSGDARSRNTTLQNQSENAEIVLDYAYAEHKITDELTGIVGKMKNPLWRPSDLLWDTDINPDGYAATYDRDMSGWRVFSTLGYFVLDESKASEADPYLIAAQTGAEFTLTNTIQATGAVSYYNANFAQGVSLDYTAKSNTGASTSTGLENDYTSVVLSAQVDMKDVFGVELVRPFAEYVINTSVDDDEKGGIVGLVFGDEKVKNEGQWQSKVSYRYLGRDAWLDVLPDSDAYGGATHIEGLEVALKYGVSKKTSIGIDYYSMDSIGSGGDKQSLFQIDLSYKI